MALLDLVTGDTRTGSGASITVVVDATDSATEANDGQPVVDWGLPVEVPLRVLHDLFDCDDTEVHVVIVRNGVILYAPGQLDLGRTTRLANRAQRRALRAMYPTCAIPGCCVRFELCVIHHIIWWRNGGRTDLINLIPLCVLHHHKIHDAGWVLAMAADRTVTITLPDGRTMTTGPPKRQAA